MDEFLQQFLIESRELVEQATGDLLSLEETPQDKEHLDSAFRAFHTLKGAAGIVDFPAMGQVMHGAEDLLAAVRAGGRPVTVELIGVCLSSLDQIVQWLDVIDAEGTLPAVPNIVANEFAKRFGETAAPEMPSMPGEAAPGLPAWVERLLGDDPVRRERARTAVRYVPDPGSFFRGEDPLGLIARLPDLVAVEVTLDAAGSSLDQLDPFACNLAVAALAASPPDEAAALLRQVSDRITIYPLAAIPSKADQPALSPEALAVLHEQLRLVTEEVPEAFAGRLGSAVRVAVQVLRTTGRTSDAEALRQAGDSSLQAGNARNFAAALGGLLAPPGARAAAEPPPPESQGVVARALRVEVTRIDTLVKLTGELTVVKNAIAHASRLAQEGADPALIARTLDEEHKLLDRLVGELQRSVLGIRVLPLRHVFQRFPRLVREMAGSLGKSVRLETHGEGTEADKGVVEGLFEPLLHVLRNAVDHGIEDEAGRRAAGKPPIATIRLSAVREGENVIVEIVDDGRGIDVARVRDVARARGAASADALAAMSEDELVGLIFEPGFSTAAAVSDVSGRGVGMDAVRSTVERLGGRVGIASRPGEGVRITFTLPFTVMMSRIMTVEAGGQMFGIPFETVIETVRVPRSDIWRIGSAKAFVLRDRTVPLITLTELLDLKSGDEAAEAANIVVTAVAGELGAVEVDRFGEPLDVMLTPIDGLLAGLPGVAGTTLLGNGRVLIVLDMQDLLP